MNETEFQRSQSPTRARSLPNFLVQGLLPKPVAVETIPKQESPITRTSTPFHTNENRFQFNVIPATHQLTTIANRYEDVGSS
jgi:hypothetical protein